MTSPGTWAALFSIFLFCTGSAGAQSLELDGEAVPGGLIFATTQPGSSVYLDDQPLQVSAEGRFVFGFGRDEKGSRLLKSVTPGNGEIQRTLQIGLREYNLERVDGVPPSRVRPDPSVLQRIREEGALVSAARQRRDNRTDYTHGFIWPVSGRLSGFYGSQRILNGEPGRPHFGLDIAANTGTLVVAPADGLVTLTHPDLYYSGGTIILDHGQGLTSSFLHLSEILVEAGVQIKQGDTIGRVGASGRASGPHLDWRMNWLDKRVDPQRLVSER